MSAVNHGRHDGTADAVERLLGDLVADGSLPGACAAIITGDASSIVSIGTADLAGRVPLRPDTRFRLASVSKPIVTALALALIEDGVLAAEDPIERWLPELSTARVMRSARGAVDDVIPASDRPRVRHLLDSTCGWGFPGDLALPGVEGLLAAVGDGRHRHLLPDPDTWVAALAGVPMLFHPGERWLYDTSYNLLGVVLARAAGRPLPALLHERLLEPLGMRHTGFWVAEEAIVAQSVRWTSGALRPSEEVDLGVNAPPRFASGAGGLIGSMEDLVRFTRMLLAGGTLDGAEVLTAASVDAMTSDQLTARQRAEAGPYLAGQSWGYGGCVDVAPTEPWQTLGRYGWIGVSGTSLHLHRANGTALVLLTSREYREAADGEILERIWTAGALPR